VRGILGALAFEENRGQSDPRVKFVFRARGYTAFFLRDRLTIDFPTEDSGPSAICMRLERPNRGMSLEGLDPVPIQTGYFRGRDASRWVHGVAHYAKVRYRDVYSGVDLVFRQGDDGRLEYDWVLAPGANPQAIRVKFDRTADLRVAKTGT